MSLETSRWNYLGSPARGSSLTFVRRDAWASVAATWFPDGTFVHWYVNFQLPMRRYEGGYDSLDLVIDIVVGPDWSWAWKDRTPFEAAVERGIFGADVAEAVESEAAGIEAQIRARTGPFDRAWTRWSPPANWSAPELPEDFAAGVGTPPGSVVTLDAKPVITPT